MSAMSSKEIENGMLRRQFPKVTEKLRPEDKLLAVSNRKLKYLYSGCVAFIGLASFTEGIVLILRQFVFGILFLLFGIAVAAAYYLLRVQKKEYAYLTEEKLCYIRMDARGHAKGAESYAVRDIEATRLFRDVALFKESESGQILLKMSGQKKTILLPNLKNAKTLYYELNGAIQNIAFEHRETKMI